MLYLRHIQAHSQPTVPTAKGSRVTVSVSLCG